MTSWRWRGRQSACSPWARPRRPARRRGWWPGWIPSLASPRYGRHECSTSRESTRRACGSSGPCPACRRARGSSWRSPWPSPGVHDRPPTSSPGRSPSRQGGRCWPGAVGSAARGHGRSSECLRARRFLRDLESQGHPVSPCCFAWLNVQFGDTGRPLEYLADTGRAFDPLRLVGLTPIAGSLSSLVPRVGYCLLRGRSGLCLRLSGPAYAKLIDDIQSS